MKSDFPQKLKEHRKLYNLKQSDLAKLLDMTTNQISTHERGVSNPNLDFVLRLAQFFNRSIEDFTNLPMREEFFVDYVVKQDPIELRVYLNKHEEEVFIAEAGLVPIESADYEKIGILPQIPEVATNFLLLKTEFGSAISSYFESRFNQLPVESNKSFLALPSIPAGGATDFLNGYPLLIELYQRFNRRSWLGNPLSWPTKGKNILALLLPNNKIIRLHISSIATGCQLYAIYNAKLENYIKAWFELSLNERIAMGLKYYINLHKSKTKLEDADEQDIASKKAIYDKILGTGENDTEN